MCSGVRMPQLRPPLSDADMAMIEAWICQATANH